MALSTHGVSPDVRQAEPPANDNPLRCGVQPIIKWAGGKRSLIPQLRKLLPPLATMQGYYEPFVGSAALFFHLQHRPACLSDSNGELINLYSVVRDRVEALIVTLGIHVNEEAHYYRVRAQQPETLSEVERAARFLYLNKTCYNGLYRVNRKGQFNVPFGSYRNPTICDAPALRAASRALQGVTLRLADYETALKSAEAGDFIYFDPPYHPVSKTASFTSYTDTPFGEDEQARLANAMRR
ncbi:MAG TPA: Dam family site-specific DNA-(adenine-N6)-methyltransferase, partial [Ktedonobacterales bacterium]|nr:Dam family site-specific DNA-(adenine-N6)-methyltransferase [Ktedonobacterales bacterium]